SATTACGRGRRARLSSSVTPTAACSSCPHTFRARGTSCAKTGDSASGLFEWGARHGPPNPPTFVAPRRSRGAPRSGRLGLDFLVHVLLEVGRDLLELLVVGARHEVPDLLALLTVLRVLLEGVIAVQPLGIRQHDLASS